MALMNGKYYVPLNSNNYILGLREVSLEMKWKLLRALLYRSF